MTEPATAAEVARQVADVLERGGFAYAIGGAIALGFYAPPRATADVDINVFISPDDGLEALLEILATAGFVPSDPPQQLRTTAREEGQFRGRLEGLRVDVFVPSIPFYAQLETRKRQVELFGRPIWILGAEDLAILKLMFFRRKDLADVEALIRDQGDSFNRDYVRKSLTELVGKADARIQALDEIARDVDTPD